MKQNVANIEKVLRIVAGLAIIGWGIYAKNWWGALGAIPLFTGLIGWCPIYQLLNVSSKK